MRPKDVDSIFRSMPRHVIGSVIELHYASPHEMVEDLQGVPGGSTLYLRTATLLEPGDEREVVVNVPLLGRQLRLRGRVVQVSRGSEPSGMHLILSRGAHDTIESLGEVLGKLRSGAMLEPDAGETSPDKRLKAMTPTLRAMAAVKAGPEERAVLARDPDPHVIEFLLKNPSLTIEEVRRLAGRLTLTHGHFMQIMRSPGWMTDDMVRVTLARNPRLPEFMAEPLLILLPLAILKNIAEGPNTTASTRRVAVRVLSGRGVAVARGNG